MLVDKRAHARFAACGDMHNNLKLQRVKLKGRTNLRPVYLYEEIVLHPAAAGIAVQLQVT